MRKVKYITPYLTDEYIQILNNVGERSKQQKDPSKEAGHMFLSLCVLIGLIGLCVYLLIS